MPGIPRVVDEHHLRIKMDAKPAKQSIRCFDEEKRRPIGKEITKLQAAGFIKEVYCPDWPSNTVLVKKNNGKWRMYVDYTSLNKGIKSKGT